MFLYHSEQRHSDMIQGKGETRIQRVEIQGTKGYKEVEYQDASGKTTRRVKVHLKPREVAKIKKNQYICGLFQECDTTLNTNTQGISWDAMWKKRGEMVSKKGTRKGRKGRKGRKSQKA